MVSSRQLRIADLKTLAAVVFGVVLLCGLPRTGLGPRLGGSLLGGGPWLAAQESQESIDDLFQTDESRADESQAEEPAAGEPVEVPSERPAETSPERVDIDALTSSPIEVSGKVSAGVGLGVGLEEWPNTAAAEGKNWQELKRFSGFFDTTATLTVDARPESYLRFKADVETRLVEDEDDPKAMSFKDPYMKEVFVDYTLRDTVFFRAGRQSLTWGQGQLLDNPANLVSRVSEGVAVRATVPVGAGTLNGVIYSKQEWVAGPYSNINPRVYAYAGQWETAVGPLAFAAAGHFKMDDDEEDIGGDIGGAASISYGIGPFDLFLDTVGHWDRNKPEWNAAKWEAMGLLVWENADRSWTVANEYQYDSSVADGLGHYVGVAVKTPKLFGTTWRPAFRWKHAFQDHSGEVVTGVSGTVAPKLKMSVGVPVVYGAPGTYYRDALTQSIDETDETLEEREELIPVDNIVSFLLSVNLSFSF